MTVTERERRRMELVDGSAHRTELCEQLAMREYELDNLKEENAKLNQQLADVTASIGRMEERCAKLRELAVLNWEWANSCCGSTCRLQTEGCGYAIDRECNYERKVWELMRELEIEVVA